MTTEDLIRDACWLDAQRDAAGFENEVYFDTPAWRIEAIHYEGETLISALGHEFSAAEAELLADHLKEAASNVRAGREESYR